MVKKAHFAKSQLEQLGLFKAVSINVDVSKGVTELRVGIFYLLFDQTFAKSYICY